MPTPFDPGAPPTRGVIPLSVPEIGGNEWRYLKECLETNWISSLGPFVARFEAELAAYLGAGRAVAVVNGTASLHVALLCVGVEPEDEVLVPSLTFIAPANAVRYCGAWPVFIDVEPEHWQMDPERLADFLERGCRREGAGLSDKATGRRVRAVLPVHLLGHPVQAGPILDLARRFGLAVVEDATESLGARYLDRPVGRLGDAACFSFNGNKTISTGGGGMIVTDNEALAERARYLTTQAKDDPVEYVHGQVGFNYRLTNLQAALGCAQLERLDEYLALKRAIAERYGQALGQVPGLKPMVQAEWARSAWWLYTIKVDPDRFGLSSRELMARLAEAGIQSRPLWQPLHLSPAHRGSPPADCPVAEELHRSCLSLPSSVGLKPEDQDRVIRAVAAAAR